LLIVGEGKEKKNLIEKVKKLGIEKNTIFMPSVENTSSVLSAMDLFVMPSLQEGLGLSIMEAMACGLAVVASEVGGIRNLIRDGFNGSLVKPKDIKKLYEVILELLKDKDKARLYGLNAHKTIANNFSQEKMVLETERVYSECLNASS
jgi:glycosyltransferase involved in cell wall biosynthesis